MNSNKVIPWIGYEEILATHKEKLEEKGYIIKPFKDGFKALSHLDNECYRLLLLQYLVEESNHLLMPFNPVNTRQQEMAIYFLKYIRKMNSYHDTPIIVPHFGLGEEKPKYVEAGATELVDILDTPTPFRDLVDVIENHLKPKI
ncbi:MAG: hypothetical protein Q7S27_05140 [Nanoarchaeota archaeon]|nr:hypothetical protein [Nanoarchaeota archaeon]